MDNTIFLVVITAELGLLCVYLRAIAANLKRSSRSTRSHLSRRRGIVTSAPAMRQVLPRAPTMPDRPSAIDAKIDIDLITYANTMPYDEMGTEDIIGIPTAEEIASVTTQDLEPDAVEHVTDLYDFRSEVQKIFMVDKEQTLAEMIEEELREQDAEKQYVDLGW